MITVPAFVAAGPPVAPRPQARAIVARRAPPTGNTAKKAALIAAGVIAFGVFYYFGLGWADAFQKHFNEKQRQAAARSGGGELGHIANLYEVLDKTEPDHMGLNSPSRILKHHGNADDELLLQPPAPPPDPGEKLSVLPAEWTLDLKAAKIPEGRANGAISGTNFVIHATSLQVSGGVVVLSLRQGDNAADPVFFIYLDANSAQAALGRTWSIAKETRGKGTPQVVKRWQPNSRFAPVQKGFNSGYAMELELGIPSDGWIPGKIFLSLPDKEKTFLAGLFYIESPGSQ
ncbi:MAG: hypothetical protein ACLQU4_18480 [Limisphaerales bacterium]